MFVLMLNNMQFSNVEIETPVARAETVEELKAFLDRERVPDYRDGRWHKYYRQGGPLEWYNTPFPDADGAMRRAGTEEELVQQARDEYARFLREVPAVEDLT